MNSIPITSQLDNNAVFTFIPRARQLIAWEQGSLQCIQTHSRDISFHYDVTVCSMRVCDAFELVDRVLRNGDRLG